MTAQEFTARAQSLHKAAHEEFRKAPADFGYQLRFSWDSASAHKAAEHDIGLLAEQLVKPPVRSPDLQRPVEDPHSIIHREFKKRLASDRRIQTVADAVKLLQQVARDTVTKEYVRKLIDGLPDTYRSIIQNKGDWAAQGRR